MIIVRIAVEKAEHWAQGYHCAIGASSSDFEATPPGRAAHEPLPKALKKRGRARSASVGNSLAARELADAIRAAARGPVLV